MRAIAKLWDLLAGGEPASRTLPIWRVAVDGGEILITAPVGVTARLAIADLASIAIETNDRGPFESDVWWTLCRTDGVHVRFPQDAAGEREVVETLMALPGFDHESMMRAECSTQNAAFPVWKGPAGGR